MATGSPPDPDQLLQHAAFIRSVAWATLHGDDLVDDVVQETWVAALGGAPQRRGPLAPWLAGVARNKARDLRRRRAAERRRDAAAARPERASPQQEVIDRLEIERRLIGAVEALPEHYRTPLVLRYLEDLPPRVIAVRLDLPVNTVRTRVRRGLAQLRVQLEADHGDGARDWRLALVPLLGTPSTLAHTAVGLLGATMAKKSIALVSILILLGGVAVVVGNRLVSPSDSTVAEKRAAPPAGTSSEDPRLAGRESPPSSKGPQSPHAGRQHVRVVVEVVDRCGSVVSGGQVSAVRLDGEEPAPIQARSDGTLYVLSVPAAGPAAWGVSYVNPVAGVLSGPPRVNSFTVRGERDLAERRLRIIAFSSGSVFVEVVDEIGDPFPGVPCRTSPTSAWENGPHVTDHLGQIRISGVVGFVHVSAGPLGRPGAVYPQLTVQPGQEKRVRLVLARDPPAKDVAVYVGSGGNPHVSGLRVSVKVFSQAVGVAEERTVVDGDPVMLPIDRDGPISAIVQEPTLGRMVFEWRSLEEAGSESKLRIAIGVRHRVRLRLLDKDGAVLPNLHLAYRRLGSGAPPGENTTGWIELNPAASSSAARDGPWSTNEAGEILTTALEAGVYEVSTDRYHSAWNQRFNVPGDADVQELRVEGVGVLSGRLEGPVAVAGQRVVIQARPWADFEGKRSEVVLALGGQFWTTEVQNDGRWALSIHLSPGAELGCAATLPYAGIPFEMRRTLDLKQVRLGERDMVLHSDMPGAWAVARITVRRGDVSALLGHVELRSETQEDRNGLIVPLRWGQRTQVGPLAPGTYAVYYLENADLGARTPGARAVNGGVRAVGLLELAAGEADYDIEIPE